MKKGSSTQIKITFGKRRNGKAKKAYSKALNKPKNTGVKEDEKTYQVHSYSLHSKSTDSNSTSYSKALEGYPWMEVSRLSFADRKKWHYS